MGRGIEAPLIDVHEALWDEKTVIPNDTWKRATDQGRLSPNQRRLAVTAFALIDGSHEPAIEFYERERKVGLDYDEQGGFYGGYHLLSSLSILHLLTPGGVLTEYAWRHVTSEFALWNKFLISPVNCYMPAARCPDPEVEWRDDIIRGIKRKRWPSPKKWRRWNLVVRFARDSFRRGLIGRSTLEDARLDHRLLAPIRQVFKLDGWYAYARHKCYNNPVDIVSFISRPFGQPVIQSAGYEPYPQSVHSGRSRRPKFRIDGPDEGIARVTRKIRPHKHGKGGRKKATREVPIPTGSTTLERVLGQ